MLHSADLAHDIEKATEASINFIFQLVALSSGVIGSEDYIFEFTTVDGAHYGLRQGRYKLHVTLYTARPVYLFYDLYIYIYIYIYIYTPHLKSRGRGRVFNQLVGIHYDEPLPKES